MAVAADAVHRTGVAPMAHRLIAVMGLLTLLGCGGVRLVERPLEGVGVITVPSRAKPVHSGQPYDEDPARLYFRFEHTYGLASWGSGMAYRQLLQVSLMAPDAAASEYDKWPPRFNPLYSRLTRQRVVPLGTATLAISEGRYAQNALDEPAHTYLYADPSRRLQIAWHVVDEDVPPEEALELLPRIAASFQMRTDPRDRFEEMAGRGAREEARAAAAVVLARATLAKAGFPDLEPGKPVLVRGVYAEWMADPEPRFQLLKPLGLVRTGDAPPPLPQLRDAAGNRRELRGSVGWRVYREGAWGSDNRDNAYLPQDGIEAEFARRQTDETTALYYFATTIRIEHAEESTIENLGGFFAELPDVERAWREGTLVSGERLPWPEAQPETLREPEAASSDSHSDRFSFGIDLKTGTAPVDALRRRLAAAASEAMPHVVAGRFDAAEARVLSVDREIQSAVMLGAMYTQALRDAVRNGERDSRPDHVAALHERALHWRLSAYPEPHTAFEADDYAAGRAADRKLLADVLEARET